MVPLDEELALLEDHGQDPLGIHGIRYLSSPIRKSMPYPIYIVGTDLNAHVKVFKKVIEANGEYNNFDIVNFFYFTLKDGISKWEENFMPSQPSCSFVDFEIINFLQKLYGIVQIYD